MKTDLIESILLGLLTIAILLGCYWGFSNPEFFDNRYMMEDGEIEYATVILLLASCVLVGVRWFRYHREKTFRFTLVSILVVTAFFFVAGEELSWGQRILDIQTTEYFKQHNAQEELNLHNMVVGDVKINKLVFGVMLTTAIMIYMVVIPVLYSKVDPVNQLLDWWYIPVPKLWHSVTYLSISLVILLIPASRNWELLEFGSVLVFFLILRKPVNYHLYDKAE